MTNRTCQAIILAAGQGTRMKSSTPKVFHQVAGLAMVSHVVKTACASGCNLVSLIIGPDMQEGSDKALSALGPLSAKLNCFTQTERLGTAHAVLTARPDINNGYDDIIVLYGDTPLLQPKTLLAMREKLAQGNDIVVMGFRPDDPSPYGRLIEKDGKLIANREAKDASEEEKKINFCNAGIMGFSGKTILSLLDEIGNNNAAGEYYLPDAIEIAVSRNLDVVAIEADSDEVQGVNTRQHLALVEAAFQARTRKAAMDNGATLIAPETVFFSYDTKLGKDIIIEPNVVFGPNVEVADNVHIKAFSHFEGARIDENCVIGPYARLRPGAELAKGAKIGNFVEIKKAIVEEGAKVNHLTYIGDARIGAGSNIGAGTITCNYDGFSKFKTNIGKGAFIGSNTALVAPVTIGDGAIIGAGSVITKQAEADSLTLTRAPQTAKSGWAAKFRALKQLQKKKR